MRFLPILHVLAIVLLAAPCRASDTPEEVRPAITQSSVWVVSSGNNRIYVGGTIHVLRKSDYPIPQAFEKAYKDSTKLVLELAPGARDIPRGRERMRKLGTYPPGDNLGKHVSDGTLARALAWGKTNSFSKESLLKLRPWYLALKMSAIAYQHLGAETDKGLESYFEKRAREDGKAGDGLETVDFQINLFAALSSLQQEQMLLQTMRELKGIKENFEGVLDAWRAGDNDKLQSLIYHDAPEYPELTEELVLERNSAWVPPLEEYLRNGERVFVLVGAAHLGGKGGVLDLLKKRNYTVTPLSGSN